ncbi:hypothetical protein BOTNAR_0699g00020 [Botryotinia narcissicola]|uniref:Uncharacterized protein n=1 Tax=Botryotinia narcissicola TaxID=278944 RepID=A0A4Z1HA75_9HELO|nr:hypothetical protein BOTNAR_0699g00020 [Botryotinia narcissicola]
MSNTGQIMADFRKACSELFYGVKLDKSDKKVKATPIDCTSKLQNQKDSGWFYNLSRDEGENTKVFQDTEKRKSSEMSSRRRDFSRKGAPGKVDRKRYSRGSRSRLRDLRKGTCRGNIYRGTKVCKDAFDLSWDNQVEENTMGNNYSETMKLSEMLWKYWGENDKMFKKTPLHHLHSLRPIVVMSYTIEGLKELLYFRAGDCPIECEVMKHLNSETLSFCTTAEHPSNVESIEKSIFPMVKERFNKSGSANPIEAAKNPL